MDSPNKGRCRLFQASKRLRAIGSWAYLKLNDQLRRLSRSRWSWHEIQEFCYSS